MKTINVTKNTNIYNVVDEDDDVILDGAPDALYEVGNDLIVFGLHESVEVYQVYLHKIRTLNPDPDAAMKEMCNAFPEIGSPEEADLCGWFQRMEFVGKGDWLAYVYTPMNYL